MKHPSPPPSSSPAPIGFTKRREKSNSPAISESRRVARVLRLKARIKFERGYNLSGENSPGMARRGFIGVRVRDFLHNGQMQMAAGCRGRSRFQRRS